MKKFLSVLFVIILAFSMVTYGFASQQFSTEVTLTVGGDGGENPDPGPGTGGENPDPGTGGENPGPGTGGENHKPSRPSGNSGRPNRPNRPSGGSANNSSHNPSLMPSTPTGAKPGGIDAEGNPYYLSDGVHVAAGIRENGDM